MIPLSFRITFSLSHISLLFLLARACYGLLQETYQKWNRVSLKMGKNGVIESFEKNIENILDISCTNYLLAEKDIVVETYSLN